MSLNATAQRAILIGLALCAMAWALVRAQVQAITIDEAVTSVNSVLPAEPAFWTAHANNHLLHSILAWGFTRIFGVSHLTVRSAALIGAAIYIWASYFLSTLIQQSFLSRLALFVCLVFNPFIFDFLVAARGYGLASGFLLGSICFVAHALLPPVKASPVRACALASICIALSFVSNFSFAFVDAATIAVLYLWVSQGASRGTSVKTRAVLAAACFLPGLLVAGALAGPVLVKWNRGELVYGAFSLAETFKSLYEASFYELRPSLRDLVFIDVPRVILPLFGVFAIWRASLVLIHARSPRTARNASDQWLLAFAAVPLVAVTASLAMHWLMFRLQGIPLPLDRTGIYIVVLTTLFLGILTAVPIPTRAGERSRRGLTVLMVVLGSYFLLCTRRTYFKEWKWDSDTDKLYSVLASYNHACGLKDIAVNWRYDGALNYYRLASGRETFSPFVQVDKYPDGKRAYLVYDPEDHDFLANHTLHVTYRAPSGAVIALNTEIAPPPGESACPLNLQSK